MNNIKKAILSVIVVVGFNFVAFNPDMEACAELTDNCIASANQAYQNGDYSEAVWDMFVNSICPNAGLTCILESMDN